MHSSLNSPLPVQTLLFMRLVITFYQHALEICSFLQSIPSSKSFPMNIPSPSRVQGLLRAYERAFKGLPPSAVGSDPSAHIHAHRAPLQVAPCSQEGNQTFPKVLRVVLPSFSCTQAVGFYLSGGTPGSTHRNARANLKSSLDTEFGVFFLP